MLRPINRRRQKYEVDIRRQENHRLLPDGTAVAVVDVVALIKDDRVQVFQAQGRGDSELARGRRVALEEKIAQNLRRHDHHVRVGAVLEIAGHDPDAREHSFQVVELLVAEGLNRGGVEDPAALGEAGGDLVLAHERLARASLRRDEHILVAADGGNGVLLEGIQRELDVHRELLRQSVARRGGIHDLQIGAEHSGKGGGMGILGGAGGQF